MRKKDREKRSFTTTSQLKVKPLLGLFVKVCYFITPPKHFFCSLLFLLMNNILFAQKDSTLPAVTAPSKADTEAMGTIRGKAKDSVYNFMLTSATVAVYKDADSSLIQYTMPNNFGEFTVNNLPINAPLHLIITHVGYRDYLKKFTISTNKKEIDMGLLYLFQLARDSSGNTMEEVVVKSIAPMRMNGDTLEFNFDAFKAPPNTTVEDQIRRLPGMVIWGDGEITYNGKKIQQILVGGKPFMGSGDPTIATQNLPKDAVEKLQVYQQRDEKNPLDSTMFANIKLKDEKKIGYFGKASAGYGRSPSSGSGGIGSEMYAADGMLSGYNKKLQMAVVSGANNVNKIADGVDALMRNASYKGEGTTLEYQSDFNMRGINKPVMGGARLQYDFIPDPRYQKTSRLNADYFINHGNTNIVNTILENSFLNADTILSRHSNNISFKLSDNQRASANYARSSEGFSLNISASGTLNTDESKNSGNSLQEKTGIGVINRSSSDYESSTNSKNIRAGFSFTKRQPYSYSNQNKRIIPKEFTISYNLSTGEKRGNSKSNSVYEFVNEPQRNRNISRVYDKQDGNNTLHSFGVSYPRLKELIFGKRSFGGINIELSAKYDLLTAQDVNQVRDYDTTLKVYIANIGLSYDRTIVTSDFKPAVQLSKYFYKGLTNRYNKYVSISFNAVQQYYKYNSRSTLTLQNLQRQYQYFVPNASIEYSNHQYGSYENKYSLNYTSNVEYPNIDFWVPLVDIANPLYRPVANSNLQPEYRQTLGFKYNFETRTPKNPWNADLGITVGKAKNNIADSTLYDDGGGRTVYIVNTDGHRYLNSDLSIRKALAVNKNNTFELGIQYHYNLSNDPRYIDKKLNISISRNQGGNFNFSYRFQDVLNLKLEQSLNYFDAEQRGFNNNRFKNSNAYSRAIATLQFPKKLIWSSNITYNRSTIQNTEAINFTIWNASLTYRFFKGDNGEVKFSALDLLRQNKGITNNVDGNVQKQGYTNVLQQYFMLTLSYYPRKFGK
jgi:hypothetical protein